MGKVAITLETAGRAMLPSLVLSCLAWIVGSILLWDDLFGWLILLGTGLILAVELVVLSAFALVISAIGNAVTAWKRRTDVGWALSPALLFVGAGIVVYFVYH